MAQGCLPRPHFSEASVRQAEAYHKLNLGNLNKECEREVQI